ncbi:MAG: peptide ABC transporter substrate-binding protein [Oscillospiraceae bacterium]|nr:peptide ABC transporter substrate-binding protein [Oscillospiraceae bacterium]
MKKNLKRILVALLTLMMVFSLCACGGKTPEPTPGGDDNGGGGDDTPKYKDTFTFAIGGEPSSMDPANAGDSVTGLVTSQIQYGLFHIGEDGSMVPDSVLSWEVSEDGLTYTFKLRDNYWSDGKKVTAEDFVYGAKHTLSVAPADAGYKTDIMCPWIENAMKYVDGGVSADDMDDVGVRAIDDNTLEYKLAVQCPYFISMLANSIYNPVRSDYAVDGDVTWANSADVPTNGPYHLTYIDKADRFEMEKNEYFWDADNVTTQKLVGVVVEDMDAQLIQFQRGEIDFATAVDATVCSELFAGTDTFRTSGAINYYTGINCFGDCEALHDRRVRRALQLGVDREKICEAMGAGDAYYPLYSFIPDGMPGLNGDWNDEAGHLVYLDYDEAKALLAEAGYDKPDADGYVLTLEYSYNASTMHTTVADVLTSEYKKIGIKIVQKTSELRTFFSDRSNGQFEICRNAFSADYMDPACFIELFNNEYATVKTAGDDHVNEEIARSKTMMDQTERFTLLHEIENYYVEEMCYTNPLFGYGSGYLVGDGITGTPTSPQANFVFWYVKVPA